MNNRTFSVSNIKNVILYFVVFFFVFFFPTSSEGVIDTSVWYTIFSYAVCCLLVLWYVISRYLDLRSLVLFLLMLVYMCIASIVSSHVLDGPVSIARIVYILLPALFFSFQSRKEVDFKLVLFCNEVIAFVILIWNICLVLNIGSIPEITVNYYSQFNWFTTSNFVANKRPVFTFGIYSYGAFFYAMLFMFWIHVISITKRVNGRIKLRYYIYIILYISYQILMRGSTALMLAAVMCFVFLWTLKKAKWGIVVIPILVILGAFFIYIQDYDWSRMILGTSTNGFTSRYLTDWFSANIQAVKETGLGIGFTVPQKLDLVYTDSGYVVLFTMGNLFLPIFLYSTLYKSLKKSFDKELFIEVLVIILLFELSLPGLLYTKEIVFMVFFFMLIMSIDARYGKKEIVKMK